MRFHPGDRVRWWDDPTHTGTVERGGAEVVDVLWDNGSGYHGHSGPIERTDSSTRTSTCTICGGVLVYEGTPGRAMLWAHRDEHHRHTAQAPYPHDAMSDRYDKQTT